MVRSGASRRALGVAAALVLAVGAVPRRAAPEDPGEFVSLVSLNLLHGYACDPPWPRDGDQCRVGDRIDLLVEHVAAGCPDLVALQEHVTAERVRTGLLSRAGPLEDTVALLESRLPALAERCGFAYRVVFDAAARRPPERGRGQDEPLLLSRYPVLATAVRILYGPLAPHFVNLVLHARIEHPAGPLDVFTTHLASGGDFGTRPCGTRLLPLLGPACPEECREEEDTVRECQARQTAHFVEARRLGPGPALLSGDFNTRPGSKAYRVFSDRGWIDSHRAAGLPECDPETGRRCTSGRRDGDLAHLESRELHQTERIDFVFVVPPAPESDCAGEIAGAGTGLFAAEPNPFAPACGAAPLPICWPSDHSGNAVRLRCGAPGVRPGAAR